MRILKFFGLFVLTVILFNSCHPELVIPGPKYNYSGMSKRAIQVHKKIERILYIARKTGHPLQLDPHTRIDSLRIDDRQQTILVDFSSHFSYTPLREANVSNFYQAIRQALGGKYKNYRLILRSLQYPIQQLIPNYFRSDRQDYDPTRLPKKYRRPLPLVRRMRHWKATAGLQNRNIALWNSHGWYYNQTHQRWEWQRPRLFQSVEDLLPTAFVLPYLVPMLENAGAMVFLPRERDTQSNEVVVDNDSTNPAGRFYQEKTRDNRHFWKTGKAAGFALGSPPYEHDENPFKQGTCRQNQTDSVVSASVRWVPDIPQTGRYAVYVSFSASDSNCSDAHYSVFHAGGRTDFLVNQRIGGGTWVYLGSFQFRRGVHADSGSVLLTNRSAQKSRIVSADAVRFGGGMGNIARGGHTSGRPRFLEGARYYLQYAGYTDSLVYNLNDGKNDYRDDYMSRPEFANDLYGNPFGPNKDRRVKGEGIPVDLSLAFHTDAGISKNDTTIGTLAIYSLTDADTNEVFPDSVSRLASRDLADILQTQVVRDIRDTFDPQWNRRALYNARYSEVYGPNMPGIILELLSHQNFLDMQFAQDPRFRFVVSRAIYKAMLRFIATENDQDYVVQPLPVTHFSALFDSNGTAVLSWQAQADSLEPSAMPEAYMVYQRIEDGGFDNGRLVRQTSLRITDIKPGTIYSFQVRAVNQGGISFPSETLSLCKMNNTNPTILIINGFDRICGPATVHVGDFSGFFNLEDNGVPDHYDINFTGQQFDYLDQSPFRMNDAPGHGASFADYETKIIAGNTFDYPYVHGRAIRNAGYSFVSCSKKSVMDSLVSLNSYAVVDLILGEEKATPWQRPVLNLVRGKAFKTFPDALQKQLKAYLTRGGNLLVSGAYIATDLFADKDPKSPDIRFGRRFLHFDWVSNHASRTGVVFSANDSLFALNKPIHFNTDYRSDIYRVEAPDALNPVGGASTILRYMENRASAAVAYKENYGVVAFGFPLETVINESDRNILMRSVLNFFGFYNKQENKN